MFDDFLDAERPKGEKTGLVWTEASRLYEEKGCMPTSSEVVAAVLAAGGDPGTANTQYYKWKKALETWLDRQQGFDEAPVLPLHISLTVQPDGRVLIPAELRRAMKLGTDGRLTAHLVDGELRLISPAVAIEKLQAYVRANDKGTGSAVDELIAERRAEAARE